jgi:predicted Zn-dependent peptidase
MKIKSIRQFIFLGTIKLVFMMMPVMAGAAASNIQTQSDANPLEVKTYTLSNGLTVYLNEDHSKPEIYGAVVVRAGSRNDPETNTGLAHYFEHIMFKGTDRIGTTNWEAEKVYLDSISLMYDKLAQTTLEEERNNILLKINQLSLKAAEYAIPNETDVLLRDIGGANLNAGTGFDMTMYYNTFPSFQLEKWMNIYAERFRNPVFRLFQSELEVVYEEKNLYSDVPVQSMLEDFLKTHYKDHPYSRPIIGLTEHLKNPQISSMMEFFNTWYVANNMALILVGDFNSDEIIPMIEAKFGQWRSGEIPELPEHEIEPYQGREFRQVRMSPVRIGLMGFRGVPSTDTESPVFEIAGRLLANGSETGIFDQMVRDNKILAIQPIPLQSFDHGSYILLFVPKIVGQSFRKAEELVEEGLTKLRNGDFSDELFQAVKLDLAKENQRRLETAENRAMLMMDAFISGKSWEDVMAETEEIEKITREDVTRVAQTYLGDDKLVYWSKMGFPKKDKLQKPEWEAAIPKNSEESSEFAQMINNMPDRYTEPRFVEFGEDVAFAEMKPGYTLYQTSNPYNDIFTLQVQFHRGILHNQQLELAAQFANMVGTEDRSFNELKSELQRLGASVWLSSSQNFVTLSIEGFEDNIEPTLLLVNDMLNRPVADESQMKRIVDGIKTEHKFRKDDPMALGQALYDFALYGQQAESMRNTTQKEAKKMTGEELLAALKDAISYEATIVYTGNRDYDNIRQILSSTIQWNDSPKPGEFMELQRSPLTENTVFLNHNKKARQSNISFYVEGVQLENDRERAHSVAFNEYFGSGMSSIVFQEIREFRSLSYAAVATYRKPQLMQNPGYLWGYMNTQSDKTFEGVQAMSELFMNMPLRPERVNGIQRGLIQSVYTARPDFRQLGQTVAQWRRQGYRQDPNSLYLPHYLNLTFNDITDFYNRQIKGKPLMISITGNLKDIDETQLSTFGVVEELKYKDFIRD